MIIVGTVETPRYTFKSSRREKPCSICSNCDNITRNQPKLHRQHESLTMPQKHVSQQDKSNALFACRARRQMVLGFQCLCVSETHTLPCKSRIILVTCRLLQTSLKCRITFRIACPVLRVGKVCCADEGTDVSARLWGVHLVREFLLKAFCWACLTHVSALYTPVRFSSHEIGSKASFCITPGGHLARSQRPILACQWLGAKVDHWPLSMDQHGNRSQ